MVKIQHKQTGEIRDIDRGTWETAKEYIELRNLWLILDEGDPVIMVEINKQTNEHREFGIFDRDHAERMVKMDSSQYYYKELNESNQGLKLRDSEFHHNEKKYPNNPAKIKQKVYSIIQKIYNITNHQVVGGLIVGIILAIIGYYFSKK